LLALLALLAALTTGACLRGDSLTLAASTVVDQAGSLSLGEKITRITAGASVVVCVCFAERISHHAFSLTVVEVETFVALGTEAIAATFAVDISTANSFVIGIDHTSDSLDHITSVACQADVSFSVGLAERINEHAFKLLRAVIERWVAVIAEALGRVNCLAVWV
jgi:pyruvate/2-oxoglutarate/acetoin dehydrogenase E1 component